MKSNLDLLLLLKSQFHQIRIHLAEVFLITVLGLLALLSWLGRHHNNTCRPLGGAGSTELGARCDKDVGNTMILAQDRDMANDVQGRDVCCENDDANRFCDGCICSWGGTFAEGFDDFFDTSFERFVDGGCWLLDTTKKFWKKENAPFFTVLNTFLAVLSSANGLANGTRAPIGVSAASPLTATTSSTSSFFSNPSRTWAVSSFSATSDSFFSFFSFLEDLWTPSVSERRFSFFSF